MAQRLLEVTIWSAKGLNQVNLLVRMNVYIIVSISGDKLKQTVKTPVDNYSGNNPYWNFQTKFIIDEAATQQNIVFNLKCEGLFGDKDIGEVRIPIYELLQSPDAINGKKRTVSYQVKKPDGTSKGSIKFAYQFGKKVENAEEKPAIVYPTPHGICSSSTNPPSVPVYSLAEGGYRLSLHSEEGYSPPPRYPEAGYYPPPPHSEGGYPPSPKHSEGEYPPSPKYSEGGSYPPPPHSEGGYPASPKHSEGGSYAPPPRSEEEYSPPRHTEGGHPPPTKFFEGGYTQPPPRSEGGYLPHSEGGYCIPPPPLEGRYPPPPRYSDGGYYRYYVPYAHSEGGYHPPPSHYCSAPPPQGGYPHTPQYAGYYEYSHPPPYGGYPPPQPPPGYGYTPPPPPPGYGTTPPTQKITQEGYGNAPAPQNPPKKKSKNESGSGAGLLGEAIGGLLLRDMISGGGLGDVGFEF